MDYSPYMNMPTFSQVHGLREMPGPPKLEEISKQGRNYLWGALWKHMQTNAIGRPHTHIGHLWRELFVAVHQQLFGRPLDEFDISLDLWRMECREIILDRPFHECFDLLQTLMRHPRCPNEFVEEVKEIFRYHLAYRIDPTSPATFIPAASKEEGDALIDAIRDLEGAGLGGAAEHLRQAGERIQDQDWAGSVRESIHAVESVAKRVAPGDSDTLGKTLAALERQHGLHGALKRGFAALYGYTSDEQGIRHAQSDDESKVTRDEAIFMIGACAAFSSYLWRKFGP